MAPVCEDIRQKGFELNTGLNHYCANSLMLDIHRENLNKIYSHFVDIKGILLTSINQDCKSP